MNDQPNSNQANVPGGMFKEDSYPWFVGGVLFGGTVVVPAGTFFAMNGIAPIVAWVGGVVSAIVFLCCLDKRGNFRMATAIPAIAAAAIGATIYNQSTGRPVAVVGGVLGFAIYAFFGAVGIGIGKLTGRLKGVSQTDKKKYKFIISATIISIFVVISVISIPLIHEYSKEQACQLVEAEAKNVMSSVADYYAYPEHIELPTINDLITQVNYQPPEEIDIQISGDPNTTIIITLRDKNGGCYKGESYICKMGDSSGRYWQ